MLKTLQSSDSNDYNLCMFAA